MTSSWLEPPSSTRTSSHTPGRTCRAWWPRFDICGPFWTAVMARARTDNEKMLGPQFDAALDARHRGDIPTAISRCHELLDRLTASDRVLLTAVHNELGYIHHSLRGN